MCAHIISPKKKWQLICGNGIVEIEGKKNLWQKTKKNLWDRFRRDINRWFYWEWSINIFQAENKNQMKRWYDWLIDSSLTIQGRNMTYTQNRSKKLLKNRNMCTTFFKKKFLSLSLSPPISYFGNTIAKNQIIYFSFSFYFGNAIATNQLQ